MKKVIMFLGLKFDVVQFRWGRKWYGGTWYYIVTGLPGVRFWSDEIITSCQARVEAIEHWN